MDNRDKDIILTKESDRNEINRYKCSICGNYQIILFNPVKKSNFKYCPMCGCRIIIK